MEIGVSVEFRAVLEPSDVRPRGALGHAQEDDFVPQRVLIIKVRGQDDFGALCEFSQVSNVQMQRVGKNERRCCCSTGQTQDLCTCR